MTTTEIYTLANELTDKEISNVLNSWEINNETKSIDTFNSLVRLGDSKGLALATTISEKYKSVDSEMYETAYYN